MKFVGIETTSTTQPRVQRLDAETDGSDARSQVDVSENQTIGHTGCAMRAKTIPAVETG